MKKFLSFFAAAMLMVGFASCEDVEDPYETPDVPGDSTEVNGPATLPYEESFASSLGEFTSYTTDGQGEWINDYSTAKATGYDNATKVTTAGTFYLVSPEFDLTNVKEAHVAYEYIVQYNKGDENQQVLITASFDAANPAQGWTLLNQDHVAGLKTADGKTDWNTFTKADLQIPAEFLGQKVRVAFRYNTNATSGSTWEVRNFLFAEGKAAEGGEVEEPEVPDTPDTPVTSDGLVENGGFESWAGGVPTSWKTASSAGNATIQQSTDARTGSYAVLVKGTTSGNKRLGYKETTYKAGTYTMTFYVKAATAEGGSVRPGYATFNADGTINSSGYKYSENYVNDLSNTEWTKVEHTVTLEADQQICWVIMNSKNPGKDVIIDDFTVSTADGGLVEGGEVVGPEEPIVESAGTFVATTEVKSGQYLIGALVDGVYKVATKYDESKTYGYTSAVDAVAAGGAITTATAAEVYTLTAVDGGYTIQDASGRYLYMTGSYNSFNLSADMPAEGAVYAITFNEDGTANIVNTTMNKTWQYSVQYTSYGAYPEINSANVMPTLFVKQ